MAEPTAQSDRQIINNEYYDHLGDRWFTKDDDPIALLRAESKVKIDWTLARLPLSQKGLDIGCGGGFVTIALSDRGHQMTGLDFSEGSLAAARRMDQHQRVTFLHGDAYRLPFEPETFDFVTCFDFLEHVSDPRAVIQEAARVLKPGGKFFFHTFDRNWLSWLVVIKGLEWFVRNTPKDLHIYPLFIKPRELEYFCSLASLNVLDITGIRPCLNAAFWKMLVTGRVGEGFQFRLTSRKEISYLGLAQKSQAADVSL